MVRSRPYRLTGALALTGAFVWSPGVAAAGAPSQLPMPGVVEQSVTFTVQNTNRTEINCTSDGGTYQVRGHIVGPAGAIDDAEAVTLFLPASAKASS